MTYSLIATGKTGVVGTHTASMSPTIAHMVESWVGSSWSGRTEGLAVGTGK